MHQSDLPKRYLLIGCDKQLTTMLCGMTFLVAECVETSIYITDEQRQKHVAIPKKQSKKIKD